MLTTDLPHDQQNADPIPWGAAALLTIDLQNDFARPDGSAFVEGTDRILPAVHNLVRRFRLSNLPVFHAIRLYFEDGSNAELCRRQLLASGRSIVRPGSTGADLISELWRAGSEVYSDALLAGERVAMGSSEWMFYKPRWSAFYGTRLEQWLASLGITTLVVAGCNFPNCPTATLIDATSRDLHVALASDATSNIPDTAHNWCTGIGVAMRSTGEIAAALDALYGNPGTAGKREP
ncbi:MAG: cysteine hydrolase [Capsulimonadaceae bacterium]|nr:cysteine hydrolase [Capsulimonadaceae bacterium]